MKASSNLHRCITSRQIGNIDILKRKTKKDKKRWETKEEKNNNKEFETHKTIIDSINKRYK